MGKIKVVAFQWCLFLSLASCLAAPLHSTALMKAEIDPQGVLITPVDRPVPAAGAEASLKVRFDVQNNTGHVLKSPEIEIRILGPDGRLKGIYGAQLDGELAVGETRRTLMRTDSLKVQDDDTIILAPVHSVLKPAAGEGSERGPEPKSLPL